MASLDERYEGSYAGANTVRVGSVIMFESRNGRDAFPCKVVEMDTAKTGKHGGRKIMLVGLNVINGKKHQHMVMSDERVFLPTCTRTEYQCVNVVTERGEDQGFVTVRDGDKTRDIPFTVDDETGERLIRLFEAGDSNLLVGVIACCGAERVVSVKEQR